MSNEQCTQAQVTPSLFFFIKLSQINLNNKLRKVCEYKHKHENGYYTITAVKVNSNYAKLVSICNRRKKIVLFYFICLSKSLFDEGK